MKMTSYIRPNPRQSEGNGEKPNDAKSFSGSEFNLLKLSSAQKQIKFIDSEVTISK